MPFVSSHRQSRGGWFESRPLCSPFSQFSGTQRECRRGQGSQKEVEGVPAVSAASRRRASTHPETGTPTRRMKNPIEVRSGSRMVLKSIRMTDRYQKQERRDRKARRLEHRPRGRRSAQYEDCGDRQGDEQQGRDHEVVEDLVECSRQGEYRGQDGLDSDRSRGRAPRGSTAATLAKNSPSRAIA